MGSRLSTYHVVGHPFFTNKYCLREAWSVPQGLKLQGNARNPEAQNQKRIPKLNTCSSRPDSKAEDSVPEPCSEDRARDRLLLKGDFCAPSTYTLANTFQGCSPRMISQTLKFPEHEYADCTITQNSQPSWCS